jgi:signal transduction histidine kinase
VVKHAPGARASVTVTRGEAELTIAVTDDGPSLQSQSQSPAAASPGLGIVGMRERVAMLDGQFTVGFRPEGGFAVVARLPVQEHGQ